MNTIALDPARTDANQRFADIIDLLSSERKSLEAEKFSRANKLSACPTAAELDRIRTCAPTWE